MKRKYIAGLATGLIMIGIAGYVQATTFNFSYDGSAFGSSETGTGTLIANYVGNGKYDVIGGSLTDNLYGTMNLFVNPNPMATSTSPDNLFYYDNILYSNPGQYFDDGGLLFTNSGQDLNLYGNGVGQPYTAYPALNGSYQPNTLVNFTINPSSVPEPATMLLLGTGLAGLAAARRRKKA